MTARMSSIVTESPLGPVTLVAAGGGLTGLYLDGRVPAKVLAAIDAAARSADEADATAGSMDEAAPAAAGADEADPAVGSMDEADPAAGGAGEANPAPGSMDQTGAGAARAAVGIESVDEANAAVLEEAARQLAEYFAGQRQAFDLPLALEGTPFQRRVWDALLGIGYGETVSYGRIADQIGQPTAVRAVGHANGRNPVSIIVPCHRVVGGDGSLTGYGGGLENKARLLDLERRFSTP